MKVQLPTLFSTFPSAFKPISLPSEIQAYETKTNNVNLQNSILKPVRQLSVISNDKALINDSETWRKEQVQKLFKLYDYYGPQWKIMSQQMPNRTANNLKNRFYTVLRNLVKSLFRRKSDTCPKLSGQIPSKDLSRLYDGKQDYTQFQCLVRNMLLELNFDLECPKISGICEKYSDEIEKIYLTIYGDRVQEIQKQSNSSFEKMNESEKILQVTCLPGQKIFQQSSSSEEESDVSKNPTGKYSECMYFFFFNPAGIFA